MALTVHQRHSGAWRELTAKQRVGSAWVDLVAAYVTDTTPQPAGNAWDAHEALRTYGDSWSVGGNASSGNGFVALTAAARTPATHDFYGVAGSRVQHIAIRVAGTWAAPFVGFVILNDGANDWANINDLSNWPGVQDAYKAALDAALAIIGSTGVGASPQSTSTQGAALTFTATGNTLDVLLGAQTGTLGQSAAQSLTQRGAAYTVTVDGVQKATGQTAFGGYPDQAVSFPAVAHLTGLGSGTHTVVVTKTDAGTGTLTVSAVLTPAAAPPTVLLMPSPPIVSGQNAGAAKVIDLMGQVTPRYSSFVKTVPLPTGWDQSTMADDGLHPNNLGHLTIYNNLAAFIAALPQRAGQNPGV